MEWRYLYRSLTVHNGGFLWGYLDGWDWILQRFTYRENFEQEKQIKWSFRAKWTKDRARCWGKVKPSFNLDSSIRDEFPFKATQMSYQSYIDKTRPETNLQYKTSFHLKQNVDQSLSHIEFPWKMNRGYPNPTQDMKTIISKICRVDGYCCWVRELPEQTFFLS